MRMDIDAERDIKTQGRLVPYLGTSPEEGVPVVSMKRTTDTFGLDTSLTTELKRSRLPESSPFHLAPDPASRQPNGQHSSRRDTRQHLTELVQAVSYIEAILGHWVDQIDAFKS